MPAAATYGSTIALFTHLVFLTPPMIPFDGWLCTCAKTPIGGREAMKIVLDLKRHCIETEMKRCTNAAISRYFKADSEKTDLEYEIALLQLAHRAFDFLQLRSR